jgi:hypothetical protein
MQLFLQQLPLIQHLCSAKDQPVVSSSTLLLQFHKLQHKQLSFSQGLSPSQSSLFLGRDLLSVSRIFRTLSTPLVSSHVSLNITILAIVNQVAAPLDGLSAPINLGQPAIDDFDPILQHNKICSSYCSTSSR